MKQENQEIPDRHTKNIINQKSQRSVLTDSLGSIDLHDANAEMKQHLEQRIDDFNTQFQKHELQFELQRVPNHMGDQNASGVEGADLNRTIDLDAKYLESTLASNGVKNGQVAVGNTQEQVRCGSGQKERGNAEGDTSMEIVPNLGLRKKLFLPNDDQFDNANSFKNVAETPLFISKNNKNTNSSASVEMPKEIHSQEKRPEKSFHKDYDTVMASSQNLMMIQESHSYNPVASPVHKHLDKSVLSGDFQSCNVMPDSGGNTHEKRNVRSIGDNRENQIPSNFNDTFNSRAHIRDKPYADQAKEVEELSKLKQKRFNSTDVNQSDNKYSYRLQVLNASEEVKLSFKSKTALRLLGQQREEIVNNKVVNKIIEQVKSSQELLGQIRSPVPQKDYGSDQELPKEIMKQASQNSAKGDTLKDNYATENQIASPNADLLSGVNCGRALSPFQEPQYSSVSRAAANTFAQETLTQQNELIQRAKQLRQQELEKHQLSPPLLYNSLAQEQRVAGKKVYRQLYQKHIDRKSSEEKSRRQEEPSYDVGVYNSMPLRQKASKSPAMNHPSITVLPYSTESINVKQVTIQSSDELHTHTLQDDHSQIKIQAAPSEFSQILRNQYDSQLSLPKSSASQGNLRKQTFNESVLKLNKTQMFFIAQGYMQPNQANWIDFAKYQNIYDTPGYVSSLLQDLQAQHSWLADNVVELVLENNNNQREQTALIKRNQQLDDEKQALFAKLQNQAQAVNSLNHHISCDCQEEATDICLCWIKNLLGKTKECQEMNNTITRELKEKTKSHEDMFNVNLKYRQEIQAMPQLKNHLRTMEQLLDENKVELIQKQEEIESLTRETEEKQEKLVLLEDQLKNNGQEIDEFKNQYQLQIELLNKDVIDGQQQTYAKNNELIEALGEDIASFDKIMQTQNEQQSPVTSTDILLTLNGLKIIKSDKLKALNEFIESLNEQLPIKNKELENGKAQIEIHKETIIKIQQEKNDVLKEKHGQNAQNVKTIEALNRQISELQANIEKLNAKPGFEEDIGTFQLSLNDQNQFTLKRMMMEQELQTKDRLLENKDLQLEDRAQLIKTKDTLLEEKELQMLALVKEVKKFRKYEQFFLNEKNKKYRNCGSQVCVKKASASSQTAQPQENRQLIRQPTGSLDNLTYQSHQNLNQEGARLSPTKYASRNNSFQKENIIPNSHQSVASIIQSKADSPIQNPNLKSLPSSVQSNHNFIDQFLSKKSLQLNTSNCLQSMYQQSEYADQVENRPCQMTEQRKIKGRGAPQLDEHEQQVLLEMLINSYKMTNNGGQSKSTRKSKSQQKHRNNQTVMQFLNSVNN